jgi:hypothetical protein
MLTDVSRLIAKFNDAGQTPNAWPDALEELTKALGIDGAACIIFDKRTGRADWVCFSGLSAAFESKYINHYARSDPFSPMLNVTPRWSKLSECFPKSILARSEWYNDFVLPCGVRDMLGSRIFDSPSHSAIFGLHQRIGRSFRDDTLSLVSGIKDVLFSATSKHVENLFVPQREGKIDRNQLQGSRFYFHVSNGRQYKDRAGERFSSPEKALAHAWTIAAELGRDKVWAGFLIALTDEAGNVIAQIPVPGDDH